MKKIVLIAAVALFGSSMIFTSCAKKKDWVCKCTVMGVALPDGPILDKKEKDAEAACQSIEDAANSQPNANASCTLSEK